MPDLPSSAALRPRASTASNSAWSVDGRMLPTLAARSAVVTSPVPAADARIRCRVAAYSFS